jgi:hypothetical protein
MWCATARLNLNFRRFLIGSACLALASWVVPQNRLLAASHAAGESHGSESAAAPSEGRHGEPEQSEVKSSGIKLGEFQIRSDYPAEAQKSTVRFVLFATVAPEHFAEMEVLAEERRQKIRDEIIITTRLTPLGIFQESDLATFRRRILIRLRRTLPELNIEQLYVSDFGLSVKSL